MTGGTWNCEKGKWSIRFKEGKKKQTNRNLSQEENEIMKKKKSPFQGHYGLYVGSEKNSPFSRIRG
jgi:hypothetical protein